MKDYMLLKFNKKKLELTEIEISNENQLEDLQKFVGGNIEIPILSERLYKNGIDAILNDEGKILKLKPTALLIGKEGILDVICGNIVFASYDREGNTVPLNEDQKKIIKDMMKTCKENSKGLMLIKNN